MNKDLLNIIYEFALAPIRMRKVLRNIRDLHVHRYRYQYPMYPLWTTEIISYGSLLGVYFINEDGEFFV